ncbi:MAG: hypothetical protein AABX05_00105 [Nanoarchaeota archaeon]
MYRKIVMWKEHSMPKFRLDALSFMGAFSSAEIGQEILKLSEILGQTETHNHYSLEQFVVSLSAEDSAFLRVRDDNILVKPYDPDELSCKGVLIYPPFDEFLGKEGYVFGGDVNSDNQGDYIFTWSGRDKLTLGDLRNILRLDYVAEVMMVLDVLK